MILIGIAGRARSGKTTTAEHIAACLSLDLYHIAYPVKQACAAALSITPLQFDALNRNKKLPELNLTPREFMQYMGDLLITANSHFLINRTKYTIETDYGDHWQNTAGYVIGDVRTVNEADYIYQNGGFLIHVQRDETAQTPAHRTENDLTIRECDYLITNNGDIRELQKKLDTLVDVLKHRLKATA